MNINDIKWKLYSVKWNLLCSYGFKNGLIVPYDEELICNLRNFYYGGIPGSILILSDRLCNGYCYDRSLFVTLGFGDDDFEVINGTVDYIKLNPKYAIKYADSNPDIWANHSIALRRFSDGSEWIYDTTLGLIIEKNLYFRLVKFKQRNRRTKEETLAFCEYQDILNADIEKDKYVLPLILPNIEYSASQQDNLYGKRLKEEIRLFKERIDYEGICREIEEDMKSMRYSKKQ